MENAFKTLDINKPWQQFKNVHIDLTGSLTILTGPNGSGKTTLLNILARHSGWVTSSLGLSYTETEKAQYHNEGSIVGELRDIRIIGVLSYTNNQKAQLSEGVREQFQPYNLDITPMHGVDCFFLPSHRMPYRYRRIDTIPAHANGIEKNNAFETIKENIKRQYTDGSPEPTSYNIKQVLVAWNTHGYDNARKKGNPKYLAYYQGFEDILKIVLPESLYFEQLDIFDDAEILVKCKGNSFPLDAASGGIATIIDLAWQIFMHAEDKTRPFTVLIDEIENHLHPAMQRTILGNFLKAFPHVSFIVSTHSPLIVNSVKGAKVYALFYDETNKIISKMLDIKNQGKSANDILDEVLGVSFSRPVWAESEMTTLVRRLQIEGVTPDNLQIVRRELKELGLEELMPLLITKVIQKKYDKTE